MIKKLILITIIGLTSLLADFKTINTKDFIKEVKNGAIIIDIRRPNEWKKFGIIENSHKITFFDNRGQYDVNKWMSKFTKIVKNKKQTFVLVCAHANRTKMVGKFLSKELGYQNVKELKGGILGGWIKLGKKTIK